MFRSYLTIALRTLWRNRAYSIINLLGLAVGMAVAMLIGLWVRDELAFDRSFANYDRLGQVLLYQTFSGQRGPQSALPIDLADALRRTYPDLKAVALTSWDEEHILAYGDQKLTRRGTSVEPQFTKMFSLKMLRGTQDGLQAIRSIMLSASTATALFGTADPIGKLVRIDTKNDLVVTGVYEDVPTNTSFHTQLSFLTTVAYDASQNPWVDDERGKWHANSWPVYVQLTDQARFEDVAAKIKTVIADKRGAEGKPFQPELTITPMSDWHLYSPFDKARGSAGQIEFVWLFSLIGGFVLLLACINFMNLSTASSATRAKEVGIRKAIGSRREQLAGQFLAESGLVAGLAFGFALLLVSLSLGWFNTLAGKALQMPWNEVGFWLSSLAFVGITTLLAGGYPAFYLTGFQPVRVLKGQLSLRVGRWAATPRRVLVVVQFAVSVSLMIGTFVVYRQIQFAKSRPIGYERSGLIYTANSTPNYNRLRADLLATGVVENMAGSLSPLTEVWSNSYEYDWPGKAPGYQPLIGRVNVTHDFGQTIGFHVLAGRDFSRAYSTDSMGVILNESAVRVMGLTRPIGTPITYDGQTRQVVGVIKDMLMQSPYEPVQPTAFMLRYATIETTTIRLKQGVSPTRALPLVEAVFNKNNPNAPFTYKFVEDAFAQKFTNEVRIGELTSVFAGLAILISCLGLFGLASFMAEQRTKEIGIRKVLGASVLHLWSLLSREFIGLVGIAFAIAVPLTLWLVSNWLQTYTYRATLPWWIFAGAGTLAIGIALLTVSFQSIRASLANPVKSLRSE